jgi:hypothetical protein
MKVVSANVLDKNEKCVNFVEMTVPDEVELTTAKDLFQAEGQPYRCSHCFDEHTFEGALFAHQKVINWNGESEQTKKGTVAVVREWSKPLGTDEFVMTVKKMQLVVDHDADGITVQDYKELS